MAKALSKSQIAASIAEKSEISKKQATEILDHIAQLAYKHAKDTFTIPGIGKLVLRSVPSRQMVMQFGEKKGQTITAVSYTHLRAHETPEHLVCRLLLEKKKK